MLSPISLIAKRQNPLVWNMASIDNQKKEFATVKASPIVDRANEYCKKPPIAVTEKRKTFAPNPHYFCSVGPYWWPDPAGGDKYINRDGEFNPELKDFDLSRLSDFANRCRYLSHAYYITKNKKYYWAFVKQINKWFIDEDSYMYPTFQYGQVIPGHNDNQGRSTGMIDAYLFNSVIESIRLVNCTKKINNKTMKALRQWFHAFADDSENRYGGTFIKANNNISLAYDVTMVNMYLFAGEENKAKKIADRFLESRIKVQIKIDGTQPSELQRTRAFFYSVYNLTHIIDFCYLARYWYPNYYQEHRERIDKAFEFLGQYVDNPDSFPYQQITSWEECKKDFFYQVDRLKALR